MPSDPGALMALSSSFSTAIALSLLQVISAPPSVVNVNCSLILRTFGFFLGFTLSHQFVYFFLQLSDGCGNDDHVQQDGKTNGWMDGFHGGL
jgi:hypothetical protein